jgi:hypothetical protein
MLSISDLFAVLSWLRCPPMQTHVAIANGPEIEYRNDFQYQHRLQIGILTLKLKRSQPF